MTTSTKQRMAGWILSAVVSAFMIFSAMGKFTEWEGKAEMFKHLGYTTELMTKIGVVEVLVAVLFLIPRAGFVGAILLTAYLGGATATHVRVGDPFYFPIVIGVLVWLGLSLRNNAVFFVACGAKPAKNSEAVNLLD